MVLSIYNIADQSIPIIYNIISNTFCDFFIILIVITVFSTIQFLFHFVDCFKS